MIGAAANAFSNQTGIVANVSIIGSVIFIGLRADMSGAKSTEITLKQPSLAA